jgi:ElaB/YqjD/DUF883 family membrane-anchored ribosome-binding protein
MNTKLVLIIAFCFVQGNRAETIADVVADLSQRIAGIRTNINGIIRDGGRLIGQTRSAIRQVVTQAETTVQNQLDQLDNIVQQAELEAAQKLVDISQCVNAENDAVSALDIQSLDNCNNNHELDLLGLKLKDLGVVKRNLSKSINICLGKNPVDPAGLRDCVQVEIDAAQGKISAIQDQINSVVDEAQKNAQTCAQSVLGGLDQAISAIAHDLKSCLLGIL